LDDTTAVPLLREPFVKAKIVQIKLIDKDVVYAHRIVDCDKILEILGQQDSLLSVFAFNESLHVSIPPERIISV